MERIRASERQYIPNMPRFVDLAKMDEKKKIKLLSILPTSMYRGFSTGEINEAITRHEASKYLANLILKNDKNKSQFSVIGEERKEETDSDNSNSNLNRVPPVQSSVSANIEHFRHKLLIRTSRP